MTGFQAWISTTPLWLLAIFLFVAMCLSAAAGITARTLRERHVWSSDTPGEATPEGQEGYVVSAVLGLLALLMGFTFSLAVDRFEARRHLVLEEANAIGTSYLRAQLLPEPHRDRLSTLLVRYTDNRIALAKSTGPAITPLLRKNDALLIDIWAATAAGFDSVRGLDFSSTFVESMNNLIDLDSARKAARRARVPPEVFAVLLTYIFTTSGVLGYVLRGNVGRLSAGFLFALLTLSLVLIMDVDRPTQGWVNEGQAPMEALRATLTTEPPQVFDRWRTPENATKGASAPD